MADYSISYGGKTTNINGLPVFKVRAWNDDIKIKFYHRGTKSIITVTPTGGIKLPRSETQLYINGKYFIQFNSNLSKKSEDTVTRIFKDLYCFGCDLEEIKRIFKVSFYQN